MTQFDSGFKLSPLSRGHHYGNFHQYYDFHNPNARYSVILSGTFSKIWTGLGCPEKFTLLDLGCNEGNLTIEMLRLAQEQLPNVKCSIVGVDIDEILIQRAQEKYRDVAEAIFLTGNCLEENYISNIMSLNGIEKFSLVSAFSITMWIQMNHGDAGLRNFLRLLGDVTNGAILLEPQKWVSYRKAMQRCRRMKIAELPHYQDLEIRDIEVFSEQFYPAEYGMELLWRVQCEEWEREALLFIKSSK